MIEEAAFLDLDSIFREENNRRGKLVVFCGFDGAGKTTQIDLLANLLRKDGNDVVVTRQPTDWYRREQWVRSFLEHGAPLEQIRVLALMAAADRLKHTCEVIDPALDAGQVVICDRYVFSTIALFTSRGLDLDFIATINAGIPKPDLTVYLDLPAERLVERLKNRDGEKLKYEERSHESIERIRQRFLLMKRHFSCLDGTRPAVDISSNVYRLFRTQRGEVECSPTVTEVS